MNLIGQRAPEFSAQAVMGDGTINEGFNLHQQLNGDYGILFFYPLDFTFVCPSELIAFNHRLAAFAEKKTQVIAVSIDSQFTHLAWRNTPVENGGVGPLGYPMVADCSHKIIKSYGVQAPSEDVALRATFLIDANGIIRHQSINDLPLGRNVDEYLRLVDAWQFHEAHGEVCPAGWQAGEDGMDASPEGVASYLSEHSKSL